MTTTPAITPAITPVATPVTATDVVWVAEQHELYEGSWILGTAASEDGAKALAQDAADANAADVAELNGAPEDVVDATEKADPLVWTDSSRPNSNRVRQSAQPEGDYYYTVTRMPLHP